MSGENTNTQETTGFKDLAPEDQILSILERDDTPTKKGTEDTKDPQEQGQGEPAEELEQDNPDDLDPDEDEAEGEPEELPEEIYELDDTDYLQVGEEHISFKDLREGHLRQADYTRKTQELAGQKKEFEENYGALQTELQEVTQVRAALNSELEVFKGNAQQKLDALDKLDWKDLEHNDPDEFTAKKLERADLREKLDLAKADQEKLVKDQMEQNAAAFNEQKKRTNEILSSEKGIPGWADETKGAAIRQEMIDYAESIGFTKEELNYTLDPRLLMVLHAASQANKTPAPTTKQVDRKKLKPVPKVTKPGSRSKQTRKQTSLADRLHSEQNTNAAADVLFDMLQRGD